MSGVITPRFLILGNIRQKPLMSFFDNLERKHHGGNITASIE